MSERQNDMDSFKTGQIVNWQRATGVEQLAIPRFDNRPYLYESPVLRQDMSELLGYDDSSTELAIVVSISYRLWRAMFYAEGLGKQGFWLIKHLCERTDMIDEKIPIRFFITKDVREMMFPYLQACNFPEKNIVYLESKEAVYPQSTKIRSMKHDALKNAKRVLYFSLSFMIDAHPTQYKGTWFRNLINMWGDEPFAYPRQIVLDKAPDNEFLFEKRVMSEYDRDWGLEVPPDRHLLWKTLSQFLNEPADRLKSYFLSDEGQIIDIRTSCFGFSRAQLDRFDLERDLYPVMRVANDESAFEAYACREGWTQDDACNIGSAFRWRDTLAPIDPNSEYGIRYPDWRMTKDIWMQQYD